MKKLILSLLTTVVFFAPAFASVADIPSADEGTNNTSSQHAVSALVSDATQAKIDAFGTLVSRSNFNVSDAAEILFSLELFPYISWRSDLLNEGVVSQIRECFASTCYERNDKLISYVMFAIISPDTLENSSALGYHYSPGIKKPTWLNEYVDGSMCWGKYHNVLSHYELTFTPLLRLQLYLELLHQTNITPDSLGHVLRSTTELTEMFMTEPKAALIKAAEKFNALKVNSMSSESDHDRCSYALQYPSLVGIHTATATQNEILEALTWRFENLSRTFADFTHDLDQSIAQTSETIDRILTSFGSTAVSLFKEIFERIAIHHSTKSEDKIKASTMLTHAGGSSYPLVSAYVHLANNPSTRITDRLKNIHTLLELSAITHAVTAADAIANDATVGIHERLKAAAILLNANDHAKAIAAYTQILKSINSTDLNEDDTFSYSLAVGLGLHKAGETDKEIIILSQAYAWLIQQINNKTRPQAINTVDVIAATEILFNAGKFQDKDSAISVINWAVYHTITGAALQEAIILGAETAERLLAFAASHAFLDHLQRFKAASVTFKDRITALKAKLPAIAAGS